MAGLPPGTVGDAVGVLIYTFICLLTDLVLIWLLWVHHERFGYVALIAYFVQICVISSIVQQIYTYIHYEDILWAQLAYIKASYPNAELIFKGANYGLLLVLSNIRYFCYIVESTYLFTYTLHVTMSIYGVWANHRRAERRYVILSKIVPLFLAGLTIGLEYTPAVQSSWTAYMFVANVQAVGACSFSIVLIVMILWKYLDMKNLWNNVKTGPVIDGSSVSWKAWIFRGGRSKNSNSTPEQTPRARDRLPKVLLDNNWLVWRLSIAIIFVTGFILATVLVPPPAEMARKLNDDAPDLSPATARSSITGYIAGVTPGIAIPIVFGLTPPFRQTLYKTFMPKRWQRRNQGHGKQKKPAHVVAGVPIAPIPEPLQSYGPWASGMENMYEMSAGANQQETPGMSGVKSPEMRPGSSHSTASFDPLLMSED
ncbi:hypothetical protein F4810DRAFT_670603 [Camillea tinctor]|nr:hypothetical protein F4810DRAFT_670603 [Camillea tinctor]